MSEILKKVSTEEVIEQKVEVEEVIEKPYTLRKLKDSDLWAILRILKKALPDNIAGVFMKLLTGEMKAEEAGMLGLMNVAVEVLKNADKAEKEIAEFCANMAGVTVEELADMEFGTTPMIFMDVFGDAKNLSFFKALSKFFS